MFIALNGMNKKKKTLMAGSYGVGSSNMFQEMPPVVPVVPPLNSSVVGSMLPMPVQTCR